MRVGEVRGKRCRSDKFHLLDNTKVSSSKMCIWFCILVRAGGRGWRMFTKLHSANTCRHLYTVSTNSHAKKRSAYTCQRVEVRCYLSSISIVQIQLRTKNLYSKQDKSMKNVFITYLVFSFLCLCLLLHRCFMELFRQMPSLGLLLTLCAAWLKNGIFLLQIHQAHHQLPTNQIQLNAFNPKTFQKQIYHLC